MKGFPVSFKPTVTAITQTQSFTGSLVLKGIMRHSSWRIHLEPPGNLFLELRLQARHLLQNQPFERRTCHSITPGTLMQTKEVLQAMLKDAKQESFKLLRVDGGASHNNLLMQLQADTIQVG